MGIQFTTFQLCYLGDVVFHHNISFIQVRSGFGEIEKLSTISKKNQENFNFVKTYIEITLDLLAKLHVGTEEKL